MQKILEIVSKEMKIPAEDIFKSHGKNEICDARKIFIYVANNYGYNHVQIAVFLKKTQPNISIQKKMFVDQMMIYPRLKLLTDKVLQQLIYS
jgi:hypothetical protein